MRLRSKVKVDWKQIQNSPWISLLITPVIATLIATAITTLTSHHILQQQQTESLLDNVQNLYIGSSKEWLDSKLGPATFSDDSRGYLECAYVTDAAILRVFYDTSTNSCQAFFVTLPPSKSHKLRMPNAYSDVVSGKALGDYSYHEIFGTPLSVWGYVSQGTARALYGEEYYYTSAGNYYSFYFLTLDYGFLDSVQDNISSMMLTSAFEDSKIDDEVCIDLIVDGYSSVVKDRYTSAPNTYGISSLPSDETISLISDYTTFDSLQLRAKNKQQ